MENKINIAELLKDCPKGMELDCAMYDNVQLNYVLEGNAFPIKVQTPDGQTSLNKYGCYSGNKHAKCVIFPKGKTTWEGFVPPRKFKVGDRVKLNNSRFIYTITDLLEDRYRATIDSNDLYEIEFEREDAYKLVPKKFDITNLKPFESRVLVRDDSCYNWEADIFGRYSDGYITLGGAKWEQCIPYEHNEHLLGTNNDCDDFYKTWEK